VEDYKGGWKVVGCEVARNTRGRLGNGVSWGILEEKNEEDCIMDEFLSCAERSLKGRGMRRTI
jgi:hypothetical protein